MKPILISLYFILLIINFVIAGVKMRNKAGDIFIFLFIYFGLVIFREAVGFALKGTHFNRFLIYHIFRPFDYAILALLYRSCIQNLKIKTIINYSIIAFFIIAYIYSFGFDNYHKVTSLTSSIQKIAILIICLYFFYETYQISNESSLKRMPLFWISCGFIIFSAGTFFSTGFQAYLQNRNLILAQNIFWINYFLSFYLYLMFIIGQLCKEIFPK